MGNKSIVHEAGARVKKFFGGQTTRIHEIRGSRQDIRDHHDGFENMSDTEWFFGLVFLVLIIVALSPGILLTIPPGRGGLFMSGNTSTVAAFVHAILLVLLLGLL